MRLKRAQSADSDLKEILNVIERGQSEGYLIRGGVLYKEDDGDIRLVVPRAMQSQMIKRVHEQGHFGIAKTEALMRKDYWISNLRPKVEGVLRNCVPCILAERKHGKAKCFLSPINKGDAPLDTFHIDYLGPLQSTKKSYAHIFVVVDAFSKFIWLYATKSTSQRKRLSDYEDSRIRLAVQEESFRIEAQHLHRKNSKNIASRRTLSIS